MVNIMNSTELFDRRNELREVINGLKEELKSIEEQISDTYMQIARDALRADGKDFGTTHIVSGNQKLKAVLRKKVVWDQTKLFNTLDTLDPDDARHYAKLSVSVEERKYTTAPPAIRQKLEECRTVEVAGFSIEVEN